MIPAPGSVRATIEGVGVVFGELLAARINGGRIAIALWGCGKTIVVSPDELQAIEAVQLSSAEIVAIADRQRSNPDLVRKREKAMVVK